MTAHSDSLKIGAATVAALSVAPAVGFADVVYVTDRPVTVSFDALAGGLGSTVVGWDIDGVNGEDTQFDVWRSAHSTDTDPDGIVRQRIRGGLNFPGLNGLGPVVFKRSYPRSWLVDVQESAIIGPDFDRLSHYPPVFNGIATYGWRVTPPGGTPEITGQRAYGSLTNYGEYDGVYLMPFRFNIAGQRHVGWARIRFDYGYEPELVIERWAYESEPDTTAHVNNIPAPPAAVSALSLLAMGAAGLRGWRRRKAGDQAEA